MTEAFYSLDGPLRVFWIIACVASLVFIVQTIMTFIGIGGDSDIDSGSVDGIDTDSDAGFSGVFSFRNLINFLLGYGWTGVLLYDEIKSQFWLYAISVLVGCLFVALFVIMFKQMMRLSHDGSFKMEECIGLNADVYLRIPAARSGKGKVQFSVKGSVHELDAETDDAEGLPTGSSATITAILAGETVLVTKK